MNITDDNQPDGEGRLLYVRSLWKQPNKTARGPMWMSIWFLLLLLTVSPHLASCNQWDRPSSTLPPNEPTLKSSGTQSFRRTLSALLGLAYWTRLSAVNSPAVIRGKYSQGDPPTTTTVDVTTTATTVERSNPPGQRYSSSGFVLANAESTTTHQGKSSRQQGSSNSAPVSLARVDRQYNWPLDRLAFGSCAKQRVSDEGIWKAVSRRRPSVWVWTGDSIYTRCPEPECIERGYVEQSEKSGGYRQFIEEASQPCVEPEKSAKNSTADSVDCSNVLKVVDGTWDDHDYGLNDGGKHFKYKDRSQKMFLDFLGISKDDDIRRNRRGVYSSHIFGSEVSQHQQVKLILLDTRYHRDDHYIPSVGSYFDNGLVACVAAAVRWASRFVGVGVDYDGDILGEEQWEWLEAQLSYDQAAEGVDEPAGDGGPAVHIIVSSVQVMTEFPVVESWGHFPRARRRLFELFKKTQPRGLVLLSGDVHYGEILGDAEGVSEITSSGLTHAIGEQLLAAPIMGWGMLLGSFGGDSRHQPVGISKAVFTGKNFGLLEFKYGSEDMYVTATDAKGAPPEGAGASAKNLTPPPGRRTVEMDCSIIDANGQTRLTLKQIFIYDNKEEHAARIRMLEDIQELIPRRSTWSIIGRACGLGLLIVWAAQIAVLVVVLGGRRLADELNFSGDSRVTTMTCGGGGGQQPPAAPHGYNKGRGDTGQTEQHPEEDGEENGSAVGVGTANKLRKRKGKVSTEGKRLK
eukprot:GHVS01071605.1.p1 GENE.GHVS01071605.1~~GHVS01071605.1.p1  ORF type:complete len:742 (+),score=120.78 GHVS01071605.1:108-2333(+)